MNTPHDLPQCQLRVGHADWAAGLLGYLGAVDSVEVRSALHQALTYADRQHRLPPYAKAHLERLDRGPELVDDTPF